MTARSAPSLTISPHVRESLSRSDLNLLARLDRERRIDVSTLNLDPEHVLWLVYYGFVGLDVDFKDHVYLVRNLEVRHEILSSSSLSRRAS